MTAEPSAGAQVMDVELWRAQLDVDPVQLAAMRATLSVDELERSSRFHHDRDRRRFVAGRGWLRHILEDQTGIAAEAITFAYDANGKPRLAAVVRDQARVDLRFNLSHSDGLGLYAVCRDRDVGVDVERVTPDVEVDALAERFFSPTEQAALAALAPGERRQAFFLCWTRKEAYVKGMGVGLSVPTQDFSVTVAGAGPVELTVPGDPQASVRWRLFTVEVGLGFVASVAVEAEERAVRVHEATTAVW